MTDTVKPDFYDPKAFFDGMAAAGLVVPTAVLGTFGRGAKFEEVVNRFNDLVNKIAKDDGAELYAFPPVMDRKIMEKVHYLETFPHLCGSVHSFFGKGLDALRLAQRAEKGEEWGDELKQTEVVLNPAACYPVYPTLTGTVPEEGRLITVLNWVYRHEPSLEPTRLQSFRMREFIRVGKAEQVIPWRDMWHQRGIDLLTSLELPVTSDVATDPFFGRGGQMRAASQKEQKLKFEVLVPVISAENPTACCSFNYHQDHFGSTFDIRTPDGEVAHTACMGFGMERIAMALFKHHGFNPDTWPAAVRQLLWS
ncbi:MAG: amino acid--[acyl-carrier-protein] ligase [Aquabacterium sp.]|uniref:amino acid--[acyl-carrier-protein] ligase n=1 Tax=Aquabacterium sp. TaxID=1872578 RepID=UPI0012086384|nr:amino acid--[acyl-carrier-protein] ligase [Aquabacterium sp.]TAK85734.1 MAG: amino acid--[acyl-carrier-protein] ligase [Aquabacterium sp.]